jgi:hypothetical protein
MDSLRTDSKCVAMSKPCEWGVKVVVVLISKDVSCSSSNPRKGSSSEVSEEKEGEGVREESRGVVPLGVVGGGVKRGVVGPVLGVVGCVIKGGGAVLLGGCVIEGDRVMAGASGVLGVAKLGLDGVDLESGCAGEGVDLESG